MAQGSGGNLSAYLKDLRLCKGATQPEAADMVYARYPVRKRSTVVRYISDFESDENSLKKALAGHEPEKTYFLLYIGALGRENMRQGH